MTARGRYAAVAAVVFALGVAALAARSYRPFAGEDAATTGRGSSTTFVDAMFTLAFILLVAVALLVLVVRVSAVRTGRGEGSRSSLRSLITYLGFVVVLSAIGAKVLHREFPIAQPEQGGEAAFPGRPPGEPSPVAAPLRSPEVLWPLVIGVALVVVATTVAIVVVSRRRRRGSGPTASERRELAAAIDVAIEDLRREPDPRRAVVAAYARMEQALVLFGVPRRPAEAPYEFLARAGRELEAEDSMAALTELFEVAKFSVHAVDEGMRGRAIEALSAVRDEVRERA